MDDHSYASPELPEPIIHRIHSLLTCEKAAQTTLLSKSWSGAWSTRPTIDLDESHFPGAPAERHPEPVGYQHPSVTGSHPERIAWSTQQILYLDQPHFPRAPDQSYPEIDPLKAFAKKTFRRYEESNLRIDTFSLCLTSEWYGLYGLATKWTLKALKLGATDLTFRFKDPFIAIPINELFGSETVVRLCLERSNITQLKVIKCSGLKLLTLSHLKISLHSLSNILSCCPLIENLSLSNISHNYHDAHENEQQRMISGLRSSLCKLTSLVLCLVESPFQNLFLDDLSSKFPNLKDFTLRVCSNDLFYYGVPLISSHSLEILNFCLGKVKYVDSQQRARRIEFDIPSIRSFTFQGHEYIPNLSFRSTSGDPWESRVSLTLNLVSKTWFVELSNFLTMLRRLSKIHLCVHVDNRTHDYYQKGGMECWKVPDDNNYQTGEMEWSNVYEVECLNVCEVEDLTLDTNGLSSLRFNSLLDGLFQICRPKMITQYEKSCVEGQNTRDNDIFLCRALEQVMKLKSLLLPNHHMRDLTDIDEVIMEKLFDEVWRPQPMDSILDVSTSEQQRFRFQLKWKPA